MPFLASAKILRRIFLCVALFVSTATAAIAADNPQLVAPTEPLTPSQEQSGFHLPPGFEIQLVAAEPEIQKPMNLAFDAQGRLFVSMSLEYPFPAKEGENPRDKICILEEFGPDGRAGKITTFADGLNIPIGVMPTANGAIGHSIPKLWEFTDEDGDGQSDRREQLLGDVGFRDTHGMTNSFTPWIDGWVYACHGFSNHSVVRARGGDQIEMQSGNTYRFKLDGSQLEYFTHGQVNPFGMAFDPLGNVYTADCHTLPAYMLLRGAWYPSFGKPHDGMGFGPTMISHLHGSTGIAGMVYYAANHFPKEYHDTLFIGNPVTGRINHDRLERNGSTYQAIEQPDFVKSDDPWFRPVDLQMGPDGALYVADFYNRIIGHYEVPLTHPGRDRHRGRIWRIVYRGTEGKPKPPASPQDLSVATADELIKLLADANLWVRTQATEQLVRRIGEPAREAALQVLQTSQNPYQRAHALWVVERLRGLDLSVIRMLASDPDAVVRVHLQKALAERTDWTPKDQVSNIVLAALEDDDAFVRRAAADALGRHPQADYVAPLLDLWESTDSADTHLIHVARLALRAHLREPGMYESLSEFANMAYERRKLAEVSLGVRDEAAAQFVLTCVRDEIWGADPGNAYVHFVARHGTTPVINNLSALVASRVVPNLDGPRQADLLRAVHRGCVEQGREPPSEIHARAIQAATDMLDAQPADQLLHGIRLAKDMRLAELQSRISDVVADAGHDGLRMEAIDALVAIAPANSVELLGHLAGTGDAPMTVRQKAASSLAAMASPEARSKSAKVLAVVPNQLATAIGAGLAASTDGAAALVEAVKQGRASARVLTDRAVADRLRASASPEIKAEITQLTADLPPVDESIALQIVATRKKFHRASGDASAGKELFAKRCGICYQIGGEGAKIGPQLDGIGQRGLDRILEDVLNPNQDVDIAFRATVLTDVEGRVITGLKLRDEGAVVVMANAEGKEVRIAREDIDQQRTTALSPMPANVTELLKEDELLDLLAYLLAQRQAPAE